MNTTRKVIAIVATLAVVVVLAMLWKFGLFNPVRIARSLPLPWNVHKPKIIVLKPAGLHTYNIEPGVVYEVDSPHAYVYTWSNVNVLKHGLVMWINVTRIPVIRGYKTSPFLTLLGRLGLIVYASGNYVVIYKPLSETTYYLSILVNETYNCTLTAESGSINIVRCDLYYKPRKTHVSDLKILYAGKTIVEIQIVGKSMAQNVLAPSMAGTVTFKFKVLD